MNEKELCKQELHPQLVEGIADTVKLKAKASGKKKGAKNAIHNQFVSLEYSLEDEKGKLSKLAKVSGNTWKSVKKGTVSVWDSLKFAVSNIPWSFKD